MLRQSVLAVAVASALIVSASAADLPNKKVIAYKSGYTWTGFYAGAHGGYGFGDADFAGNARIPGNWNSNIVAPVRNVLTGSKSIKGAFAGLHAGYLHQFNNNIVVGAEIEGNFSNIEGKRNGSFPFGAGNGVLTQKANVNWFGSARAKLGYAFDRVLVYATGGVAYAGLTYDSSLSFATIDGNPASGHYAHKNDNKFGYTFGAGVAYAVTDAISVSLEYARYDFGKSRASTVNPIFSTVQATDQSFESAFNTVRVGITYKF